MTNLTLPQRFEEFSEARRNGFLRVKQVKENGGLVAGTFCTFTPMEILDAAGFTPVSLCGMSEETVSAAEVHLPKNLCPLIKSSYGFAVSDKCPYTYFSDLIVGETTCDGKKKMYELLGKIKPTYILHLPQGQDRGAIDDWTKEIHRFIDFLEQTFHVQITEDMLRQAVHQRNAERQARMRLMELQKLTPPPMRGQQLYSALEGIGFCFEAAQRVSQLDELRQDVMAQYDVGSGPIAPNAKRILITGCPIGGVLNKTVKLIEENGGVVVCFENCSGIKAAFQMVDEQADDIVRAIAEKYLAIGCSVMTPNRNRIELLQNLVAAYQVDGVVEIDLQACTPYTVEAWSIRQAMREMDMPYLAVETDYSGSDSGQLSTRLEAFLESI